MSHTNTLFDSGKQQCGAGSIPQRRNSPKRHNLFQPHSKENATRFNLSRAYVHTSKQHGYSRPVNFALLVSHLKIIVINENTFQNKLKAPLRTMQKISSPTFFHSTRKTMPHPLLSENSDGNPFWEKKLEPTGTF